MAERVEAWWARRQFSRGVDVPYPVGTYRDAWAPFPVLIRQYHPELNAGITLTQIPPAADVLLLWQCDAGHLFAATPAEQRARPGRERRRSVWCPECARLANPPRIRPAAGAWPAEVRLTGSGPAEVRLTGPWPAEVRLTGSDAGAPASAAASQGARVRSDTAAGSSLGPWIPSDGEQASAQAPGIRSDGEAASAQAPGIRSDVEEASSQGPRSRAPRVWPSAPAPSSARPRARPPKSRRPLCEKTPALPVGEPFVSECAPRPASAVEERLRADLFARLGVTAGFNSVRVNRPFFDHLEVWPDILLPELRIAVEYDSPGRFGLEHVGKREDVDRRKDRALRSAGWEVVRIRTGKLEKLGPHDLQLSSLGGRGVDRLLDVFRDIRGALLIDAYLLLTRTR